MCAIFMIRPTLLGTATTSSRRTNSTNSSSGQDHMVRVVLNFLIPVFHPGCEGTFYADRVGLSAEQQGNPLGLGRLSRT